MVKAKDFWNYLCDDLNYRFFSGIPCKGLKPLYDKMDADKMFYIPATKESIALGMVCGSYFSGVKGGILLDINRIMSMTEPLLKYVIKVNIPLLIFLYGTRDEMFEKFLYISNLPVKSLTENYEGDLNEISSMSVDKGLPGIIIIGEGVLR